MALKPGDNSFHETSLHPEGNFVQYDLEIVPDEDTSLENNRASAVASPGTATGRTKSSSKARVQRLCERAST